uniref:Retinoic acid induced 14 n=1 Tax=Macaca nemestrina TaxID=9545 RepID=A0A2K6B8F5_MACNE
MSGTRMMTGCCRPWRMEMRRRWPHCSARRGPAPPNTTARARPLSILLLRKDTWNASGSWLHMVWM